MAFRKGHAKLGGRIKGTPNKISADIKDMIRAALQLEGGVEYLRQQARKQPQAFLGLLGRLLPSQIKAEIDLPLVTVRDFTGLAIEAAAREVSAVASPVTDSADEPAAPSPKKYLL